MQVVYPNGASKAFTLSYDDGIEQDKRLIEMMETYGIKGTFNISSGLLDEKVHWQSKGVLVPRLKSAEVVDTYRGHEIACHGLTHPNIACVPLEEKTRQIVEDKVNLEKLTQNKIEGMAYPFGGVDDDMIEIMKACDIQYGRVVPHTGNFDLPKNLYKWQATCHHNDPAVFSLAEDYLNKEDRALSLFYIWGHAYEFDMDDNWDHMDRLLSKISRQEDIWYCTNIEFVNYYLASRLLLKADGHISNPSMETIYLRKQGQVIELGPGSSIPEC